MAQTTTSKKINHIFALMIRLASGEELYAQNKRLTEEIGVDERTMRRYLNEIHEMFGHIVVTEKKNMYRDGRKVTIYRVPNREKDVSEVLKFFLHNSNELGWILQMIQESDPTFLNSLSTSEYKSIEKNIKEDKNVFLFVNTPFEDMENSEQKKIFAQLKTAVKNREYRTIEYQKDKNETLENLKCLKLIFMHNNWYLATENDEKEFRLLRLSFVRNVAYSSGKVSYQKSTLEKYDSFFKNIQNPFTVPDKPFKKAVLEASSAVAIYFEKNMKKFFPSQEYIETYPNGSVRFSVEYTQPMEILPFVKQWIPDIKIIEPAELKEMLLSDLGDAMK